ncbi:Cytochrome P450 [Musa troglodytarum]|uniref:Cytochrome P450 n=3 Tax=Musa troglodytarum TaxID=320322 RepID=A0A9E7GRI4_9LILI|nr:Cytochrome P450 [Musa troglodytarum]
MELWLLIFLSVTLATLLFLLLDREVKIRRLPPGPPSVPILGNLLWLRRSLRDIEDILRELHARYGPVITLRIGSRATVFIADRTIAHKALVEHGAAFSDRPAPLPAVRFLSVSQHNISTAAYGPIWRLLRRNLSSEILHHSRVKLYAGARAWVLGVLIQHLRSQADAHHGVVDAMESFQFAMFCLLVLMCFGEKLDEKAIKNVEEAQRSLLLYSRKLSVLAFVPSISRHIFRNRLKTVLEMRERQEQLYLPLIEARKEYKQQQQQQPPNEKERFVYSYVDSLLEIELPEEGGRKLSDEETVALCSEFLNAGTDTTSTALQWIMANLVKHQDIQEKLRDEIDGATDGRDEEEIKEEDLQRMPYLKAVILEGLRRHPPGHFVLSHAVTEDVDLCGYLIPKGTAVNFCVAEMNWDGKVWEEPMEFKPERFLSGGGGAAVDITGSREITMMPFGAGRRICPGLGLAMLHLEYFVANLVREFEWKRVEGEEVDMTEKLEFTVVMKNRLRARIIPRRRTI